MVHRDITFSQDVEDTAALDGAFPLTFSRDEPDPAGRLSLNSLVLIDKLQLLYRHSVQAVVVSLVIAAMLTAILWLHNRAIDVLLWYAAIVGTSLLRAGLFWLYRRNSPQGEAVLSWRLPYVVTLLLSSAVWGLGLVLVVPQDSLLYQAIAYYFLMGMSAGALSIYYSMRSYALMTLVLMLGPMTVWMFVQAAPAPALMGVAALVFLLSARRATGVLSSVLQRNFYLAHELKKAKERAEDMARTDALTGLNNRRAFMELAEQALSLCRRAEQSAVVIVLDIDHFKQVNDTRGHAVGDLVLQHIGRVLACMMRESDVCARLGGEEFVVFMPNTSLEGGMAVAEKLRQSIEGQTVLMAGNGCGVTASIGVAWSKHPVLESLLLNADHAMYRAKQGGRNRVCAG